MNGYQKRRAEIERAHRVLLERKNPPVLPGNGIFTRYRYPVLEAEHTPLEWRYDFNPGSNPFFPRMPKREELLRISECPSVSTAPRTRRLP